MIGKSVAALISSSYLAGVWDARMLCYFRDMNVKVASLKILMNRSSYRAILVCGTTERQVISVVSKLPVGFWQCWSTNCMYS